MRVKSLLIMLIFASQSLPSQAFPMKSQASHERPAVQRRVAYSVVPVDGGSTATSSSANLPLIKTIVHTSEQTEIVTAPAVTLPPSFETIISTAVITTSGPAVTVHISTSESAPPTIYQVVNPDESSTPPTTSYVTVTSTASRSLVCTSSDSVVLSTSVSAFVSTSGSTPSITQVASPTSMPDIEATMITTAPAEAGWVAPPGLLPPSSTIMTYGTQSAKTSKTYDNGMWHTTWRIWNATSTASNSFTAPASITTGTLYNWKKR